MGGGGHRLREPRRDRVASKRLSVREGSAVEVGSPLFTLDDDLQRAAVAENEAAVVNAKQAYDRAEVLLKKRCGHRRRLRRCRGRPALGRGKAQLDEDAAGTAAACRARSPGTIQEVYFRVGEMVRAGPTDRLHRCRRTTSRCASSCRKRRCPSIHIGDRVAVHCDGCRDDLFARVSFISAQAEFTPPVIYSLEERARLVFRIEALPEQPEDATHRTAGVRRPADASTPGQSMPKSDDRNRQSQATTAPTASRHRRRGPHQVLRRQGGGARPLAAGAARANLRLPRSQRLRQDHDAAHDLRAADAGWRARHLPRLRHSHRAGRDQAPRRLHDAAVQPLPGSVHHGEPRVRGPRLRSRRPGARPRGRPSSGSGFRAASGSSPARCPAAGSSAWRSAPASCPSRICCCSTSPPPASTPRRGASSGARSTSSRRTA